MTVTNDASNESVKQFLAAVVLIPSIVLLLYLLRSKWSKLKQLHKRLSSENEKQSLVWYQQLLLVLLGCAILCVDSIKSISQSYKHRVQGRLASIGSRIKKRNNRNIEQSDPTLSDKDNSASDDNNRGLTHHANINSDVDTNYRLMND